MSCRRVGGAVGVQFLQTDPIGYGDGLNWYAYVGNDPLNRTDPTGNRRDPGDLFGTPVEAAKDAVKFINPTSIAANREYGGTIERQVTSDGLKYVATTPTAGTDQGFSPSPTGNTVGDYHTHGDYSTSDPSTGAAVRISPSDPNRAAKDQFGSDNFSAQDRQGIASDAAGNDAVRSSFGDSYVGALGTPSGNIQIITIEPTKIIPLPY